MLKKLLLTTTAVLGLAFAAHADGPIGPPGGQPIFNNPALQAGVFHVSSATIDSLHFNDGSTMTSASNTAASGTTIYSATSSASFPFGLSASTVVVTGAPGTGINAFHGPLYLNGPYGSSGIGETFFNTSNYTGGNHTSIAWTGQNLTNTAETWWDSLNVGADGFTFFGPLGNTGSIQFDIRTADPSMRISQGSDFDLCFEGSSAGSVPPGNKCFMWRDTLNLLETAVVARFDYTATFLGTTLHSNGIQTSTMSITGLSPGVAHVVVNSSNVVTGLVQISTETNLTVSGPLILSNSNISMSGVSLTTGVTGVLPAANLPTNVVYTDANQALSGTKLFTASATFSSGNPSSVTYGLIIGSEVITGLSPGVQHTLAGSSLTVTALVSLSTEATGTLQVAQLPALFGNVTSSSGSALTTIVSVPQGAIQAGSTNYLQNTNTLQVGSTFYSSSGTVAGQFMVIQIGTQTAAIFVSSVPANSDSSVVVARNSNRGGSTNGVSYGFDILDTTSTITRWSKIRAEIQANTAGAETGFVRSYVVYNSTLSEFQTVSGANGFQIGPTITYPLNNTALGFVNAAGTNYIYPSAGGEWRLAPASGAKQITRLADPNLSATTQNLDFDVKGSTGEISWNGSTFTLVNQVVLSSITSTTGPLRISSNCVFPLLSAGVLHVNASSNTFVDLIRSTEIATTGVGAGLFPIASVTVNAQGQITAISSGTATSANASIAISSNNVIVSSPTSNVNFMPPFIVALQGSTSAQVTLNSSSVTLQGVLGATTPVTLSNGLFGVSATSVTLQGNTFNGNSQLLQLDGSARYPALNGNQITALTSNNLIGAIPISLLSNAILSTGTLQGGATAYPQFLYVGSSATIPIVTASTINVIAASLSSATIVNLFVSSVTNNVNMASHKLTNLSSGTATGDSVTFNQNKFVQWVASVTTNGTGTTTSNTFTAMPSSATINLINAADSVWFLVSGEILTNNTATNCEVSISRNGTNLGSADGFTAALTPSSANARYPVSFQAFDIAPGAGTNLTYNVTVRSTNGSNACAWNNNSGKASITLWEVAP